LLIECSVALKHGIINCTPSLRVWCHLPADKKVYLKTLSIINMIVQAVTTFVAVIGGLWRVSWFVFLLGSD
jgi:hypothetical protein